MSDTQLQTTKPKQRKPRKAPPPLAVMSSVEEMAQVNLVGKVEPSPTSWDNLPVYAVFSGSSDGSFPMIKVNKSMYSDMRTGQAYRCGSGRCYRIFF